MVEQVDNIANRNMHYGDIVPVKNLTAPDYLPKKTLYSDREASAIYNQMSNDVYEASKHASPYHKTKFPTVLKILLGIGGIATLAYFRKDVCKFFKNIFKIR